MWDTLWINAHLATMEKSYTAYGAIPNGAIAIKDDRIAWVGPMAHLTGEPSTLAKTVRDAGGRWITPGLIDCHTHLIHGGNRAGEFEMRLAGASYKEISESGGGIVSTVKATRQASVEALVETATPRLESLLNEGVTTIEIKSGYGLDIANEVKMLRAAKILAESHAINIKTSFLGAHALPAEFKDRADDYIDLVCGEMLDEIVKESLADVVDVFMESIAFNSEQTEKVFKAAQKHGLPVKLHADQLSDSGGAALAAKYGALSADHIEYISDAGLDAMAKAGTVATVLPGAFYFLRETKKPPIQAMRDRNIPIAIATDSNPGSSPVTSLLLMLNMASTLFDMTPEEGLAGITRNGALALGMGDTHGTLTKGKHADFVLWDISEPAELAYRIGANPCAGVIKDGLVVR